MTTTPILIALTSPSPGAGKSTVADHLIEHHDFLRAKFAGPLKDMVRVFLQHAGIESELIERYVEGDLKETQIPEIGASPRWLMQSLGQEWGRDLIRSDLWVHIVEQGIAATLAAGFNVVIDDLRYPNEFEMVLRLNGIAVRVVRPGCGGDTNHGSEGGLNGIEMCELVNAGTRLDLRLDVDRLLSDLLS